MNHGWTQMNNREKNQKNLPQRSLMPEGCAKGAEKRLKTKTIIIFFAFTLKGIKDFAPFAYSFRAPP